MEKTQFIDKRTGLLIGSSATAATSLVLFSTPAQAEGIDDVSAMLTSVAAIAGSAVGIVVLAMGVRIAIKQVNRVMTKG